MNLLICIPFHVQNVHFTEMMVGGGGKLFVCLFASQMTGHDLTLKFDFFVFHKLICMIFGNMQTCDNGNYGDINNAMSVYL